MNGYELSRRWFDWCFENPELHSCTHTALYMWICEKWNRLGQKDKFGLPTSDTMEVLSIKSKTTYHKVFSDLVEWGFIKIVSEAKNQNQSRVISLNQKMIQQKNGKRTALDKALVQQKDSTVPIVEPIKPLTINQEIPYRSFAHLKLSNEEFQKLKDAGYSKQQIDDILDRIENYKNKKNYTSLYLTALTWLRKEKNSAQKEKKNPNHLELTESNKQGLEEAFKPKKSILG